MFEEGESYRDLTTGIKSDMLAKDPNRPKEWLPKALFRPEVLNIRRIEDEASTHTIIRWGIEMPCGDADVDALLGYLRPVTLKPSQTCH